jgi:predicted dehydrogenase
MTNDKFVKVGIIGVGGIGSAHAASIYSGAIDGMRLCALCDTSEERVNALKELYPDVPIYTSDDEFFEKALKRSYAMMNGDKNNDGGTV